MGGLVRFSRKGARKSDAEWHDGADSALRSPRKISDAAPVTWIDATRSRDSDDDNDGGGAAA